MNASVYHQNFFLQGPAGRLEATIWTAEITDPPLAALACHPHPLFGGTMHNKVVFRVARTLHQLSLPVLRFNFRGAGLSEGTHDQGRGERDDVRAALDWLADRFPAKPIVLAGFSFGAGVGLEVGCSDRRVEELVALGLPVDRSDFPYLRECGKPKLFLQGSEDQFGGIQRLRGLVATLPEPKRLVIVGGVDHFFTGKLEEMAAGLRAWVVERHPLLASRASGKLR